MIDLGAIESGRPVEAVFTLRNITSSPISIVGTTSTCTCTVPGLVTPTTVGPWGSREIRVAMDVGAGHGEFSQAVSVYTDQNYQPHLVLTLKGTLRAVETEPEMHAVPGEH